MFPPLSFAARTAWSALRSHSATVVVAGSATAMPMLTVRPSDWPPRRIGSSIARWIRVAVVAAARSSAVPAIATTNSSPPKRATSPSVPTATRSRSATRTMNRSPASWPRKSFIALSRSTSTKSSARIPGSGDASTSSRWARTARRLGRSVSSSWWAMWRSRSSASRRACSCANSSAIVRRARSSSSSHPRSPNLTKPSRPVVRSPERRGTVATDVAGTPDPSSITWSYVGWSVGRTTRISVRCSVRAKVGSASSKRITPSGSGSGTTSRGGHSATSTVARRASSWNRRKLRSTWKKVTSPWSTVAAAGRRDEESTPMRVVATSVTSSSRFDGPPSPSSRLMPRSVAGIPPFR